jgi:hypothetical protein
MEDFLKMKGFSYVGTYDTRRTMTDTLIYKTLPYGKWTTKNGEEYLFNREYEPIAGWDNNTNTPIPVLPTTWIHDIVQTEGYYGGDNGEYPTYCVKTFNKCMNILADWSNRRPAE